MPPSSPHCPIPKSAGFVRPEGPIDAEICFIGEAAGDDEARRGRPFCGAAGGQLDRILQMLGWDRSQIRIGNTRLCSPPGNWLVGAPWENSPCAECDPALEALLAEPHKVFVTLGGTALRRVLGLKRERGKEPVKLENFHGAPVQDQHGRWIVPTFHPSFLLQGGQRFTKTVCYDLQVAREVASEGWKPDVPEFIISPPTDWFEAWAQGLLEQAEREPGSVWLAIDFETEEKEKETDEGELKREGGRIIWANLASGPDHGITVDWVNPYKEVVERLLESPSIIKLFWHAKFDCDAAEEAGIHVAQPILDFMDAWHALHPTLNRGLGFVSPFYSGGAGPWKHRGIRDPIYRCMDAAMTYRNALGITEDLKHAGMWDVFFRHEHLLDKLALRPAEAIGLPFDKGALEIYNADLQGVVKRLEVEMQSIVPESICPLDGPYVTQVEGWNLQKEEKLLVQCCETCGEIEVQKRHRCGDKTLTSIVRLSERLVTRYYRREPFNPGSWQQVLAYIKHRGHKPGKAKKTKKDTTDKKTLMRLAKTGDLLYLKLLEHRQVEKMRGTYAQGMLDRLDANSRVHPTFSHVPYSMRLASQNPNGQNMASHVPHADGFRRTVVASSNCKLLSLDYSGIEAVEVGWWSQDPDYLRLAKLGIHAYVETHHLKIDGKISEAANPKWADADLRQMFKEVKSRFPDYYEKDKRTVHGVNYLLTAYGLAEYYPEIFPSRKEAQRIIDIYYEVCPKLGPMQKAWMRRGHEKKMLGGPSPDLAETITAKYWELVRGFYHPFGYRAEFFGVLQYRKIKGEWKEYLGQDAKKVVAWPHQSSAAGNLAESMLILFDPDRPRYYIGDAFYGQTPLRAPIHDELLLEVPDEKVDEVLEKASTVMRRPVIQQPLPMEWGLGDYLTIGVAAKVGRNWAPYHAEEPCGPDCKHQPNLEGMRSIGVEHLASDVFREEEEDEDEDVA